MKLTRPPKSQHEAERQRARRLRWAFLLLLAVALAQVCWWMIDQTRLMNQVEADLMGSVSQTAAAAQRLLAEGVSPAEVEQLFPQLTLGDAITATGRVEEIRELRRAHLNQYRWEGAFFLAVLGLGVVVLSRAISREVELRHRQENFLAAVTHELKSPLASLRLALQTMERRSLEGPQRRLLVERNLLDLDRLEGLISNVLESSRLEAGVKAGPAVPVNLATAADQVIGSLARIDHSGCDVVNEIPRDLVLETDQLGIATILRNLVDNALEAVKLEADPRVRLAAGRDSAGVWLSVEDNGVGFEPEQASRLFQKFYRPGDELTRSRAGTGLGLFLVRRIAELEAAKVRASSEGVGRGAKFEVRWP